jgi:HK97 family phage major capsid protein/HK97 family phage prohead protease
MANVNGTDIDLMPTDAMRAEARRYREWKAEGNAGGTEVAATRASQILSGDELSPDTVVTMSAWFARHEVDKQGEGFSPGEDGYPSPGRVAWAAWGGDPGQTWSTARSQRIQAAQDRGDNHSNQTAPVVEVRELNSRPLRRVAAIDDVAIRGMTIEGEEDRGLRFSFSSEAPVERWFGTEVLSHADGAADLSRLNDGAPLLWNHDPDRVLGVVERGWMEDGRGMVQVRFSRSAFAEEKLADIRDGILRNVSVGYSIMEAEQLRQDSPGILATSWQPHEVSVVSVPADATVGIGRSLDDDAAAGAATQPTTPTTMEPTIDIEAVRAQAAADERTRVASITSLCREHNADDLSQGLIERGASESEAMRDVLAAIGKRAKQPAQPAAPAAPAAQPIAGSADIGLSQRESQQFSFLRAIRALANPGDRAAQEAAGFERECSHAVAQRTGQDARGLWVPHDVLRRDLTVSTASAAGDLVFTDARPGSFIELLRNRLALTTLGVTTLTGLQGPVAIPRQTGSATAYWVAEGGAPTESNPTVDQVAMTPRTVGGYVDFTRRLMLQSSIDVEQMVRTDLSTVLALEIDRTGLYGLGSSGEPQGVKLTTGINTKDFTADSPTYAELVDMETSINADNADIGAMAYLTNSTRYGAFKTTEKASSTAQFVLEPGGTVNGYRVVVSNQVSSGDVWFGVWNQLILGLWSGIDLTVDTTTLNTSGGVRVIALQDVDFAVRHPEAFCRGNNTL